MFQPLTTPLRLHQNPGDIPPEVPNIPSPQPEINPGYEPQPEMPPSEQDPISPDSPSGPGIVPQPSTPEMPPLPEMGARAWLH
jgi:hypothetical protein